MVVFPETTLQRSKNDISFFFFPFLLNIYSNTKHVFFFLPKLPLFRYGAQRRRELPPSPDTAISIHSFPRHSAINGSGDAKTVRRHFPARLGIPLAGEKQILLPARATFVAAGSGERGAGGDGEGGHLLRREVALEAVEREREI